MTSTNSRGCRCRRRAVLAASLGVVGGPAVLVTTPVAAPARADSLSPLTELVDAAAQRLQLAEAVAAFKWSAHGAIEDPDRVQQELATLGADATAKRIGRANSTAFIKKRSHWQPILIVPDNSA
jgi:chorismate mutase